MPSQDSSSSKTPRASSAAKYKLALPYSQSIKPQQPPRGEQFTLGHLADLHARSASFAPPLVTPALNRLLCPISYKQQKFNLLREESEGYAKLAVELATNMGPSHDPRTGKTVETAAQRMARAKRVNEAVQSIIGELRWAQVSTQDMSLTLDLGM